MPDSSFTLPRFVKGTDMRRKTSLLVFGLFYGMLTTGVLMSDEPSTQKEEKKSSTAALERTRKTVRMLDDV